MPEFAEEARRLVAPQFAVPPLEGVEFEVVPLVAVRVAPESAGARNVYTQQRRQPWPQRQLPRFAAQELEFQAMGWDAKIYAYRLPSWWQQAFHEPMPIVTSRFVTHE